VSRKKDRLGYRYGKLSRSHIFRYRLNISSEKPDVKYRGPHLASKILQGESLSPEAHKRTQRDLFYAFVDACKAHGTDKPAIIDGDGRGFRYADLMRASFALSSPIKKHTRGDENVGILLPTGAGAVIAFLSIHAAGRVPAMLNFTAGMKNLKAAADTAPFDTIVTAHKFIEIAGLESLVEQLAEFTTILYLEDLQKEIGVGAKIRAILGPIMPSLFVPKNVPDDTGVILFTSGTEGNPKGVVLTHANILANVEQIEQHVELEEDDIIFNPLPVKSCCIRLHSKRKPLPNAFSKRAPRCSLRQIHSCSNICGRVRMAV